MKVKYIGKENMALTPGAVYDVISVEKGWYRIMTELEEDYLFPPKAFEIVYEPDVEGNFITSAGHIITVSEKNQYKAGQTVMVDGVTYTIYNVLTNCNPKSGVVSLVINPTQGGSK